MAQDLTPEINAIIERVAAIEAELPLLMKSAKSHEQSAADAWKTYFALKEERQGLGKTLASKQVVIATQNAQQAAQQAQSQAEATAKEAEKTLASLKEQEAKNAEAAAKQEEELKAKHAEVDAMLAKLKAAETKKEKPTE